MLRFREAEPMGLLMNWMCAMRESEGPGKAGVLR